MGSDNRLFSKYDFSSAVRRAPEALGAAVTGLDGSSLMTDQGDDLIERLVREHSIDVPVLRMEGASVDEAEVEVDVGDDPRRTLFGGRSVLIKATEYRFHVPFDGEPDVFYCRPSTYDFNPPCADVNDRELVIRVVNADREHDVASIRREFDRTVERIGVYLERLRADSNGLDDRLRQVARASVEQRREKRRRDADVLEHLGFPRRESRQ